jgi:hypothetical protein
LSDLLSPDIIKERKPMKKVIKSLIRTFFYRDNVLSKTAIFLTWATVLVLILWPFQELFQGHSIYGWVIPPFNPASAASVTSILSFLYLLNHSAMIRGRPGTPEAVIEHIDAVKTTHSAVTSLVPEGTRG